ncbi:hypothetical protein E3T61_17170 [Cryobacterium lactosi]|uniref:Uncharacterized protein n=1 Tax=Cryobacterium lactosi TaxID=1259202 RepID=A0A4R9BJC4_9MICO|nr:hypothetical protein [Cryobacterium lactosi]TFD85855.1 hypothetical protein E3T61_17170 [Cryobacterium lactosi]
MSARHGNWHLLDHSVDPVGGDPIRLTATIKYYREMAETITSEAAMLTRIGDGDSTELKGEAADALRSSSRKVAESLSVASGRYEAVRVALTAYAPELDLAIRDSGLALADADAAEASRISSQALVDPSANRSESAPPLTEKETLATDQRTVAIGDAQNAAADARVRLSKALTALQHAGETASKVITAAWDDGLTDTRAYKIKQDFIKFLKMLVKVFMWIGVALAVLAFFIPGLGALAIAGAAVAVVALAASTALAAMGEGSWLDVILAAVTVLLIGAGAIVAKLVQASHIKLLAQVTTRTTKQAEYAAKLGPRIAVKRAAQYNAALKGDIPLQKAMDRIARLDRQVVNVNAKAATNTKILDDFKVQPQWWRPRDPAYRGTEVNKIKDVLTGNYRVDRLVSVDRALKYRDLREVASTSFGIQSKVPPAWHFANGGRVAYSWGANVLKIGVTPTAQGGDTSRWSAYTAGQATLTTPKP